MAVELRNFSGGGMDTNNSPENIAPNDYVVAYNCRVSGTAEGEDGYITNIESTEEIDGVRSEGINKTIGAQGFELLRKGLSFIYNSQELHQIIEVDYDTLTETVLYTNKTNSGNENILPLDPQYYITDIKRVGDFYVFTDGNMQPCYINRERLLDGSYGTLTQDDFLLIKAQILSPPIAVYNDDASRSVNLMSGNLFQFRNQVVYLDNEYSAFSSISKRPVPTSEGTPTIGTDVTKNNNIIVSTHIGTNRVDKVIVVARIGSLDWFTIKSKKRSDILAITNTAIDVANEIYEAYDPATGLYSFAFYNDGLYNNVNVLETDLLADSVPLKAESLEVLNGNVLALAGLTEGYLRPDIDVEVGVSTYQPDILIDNPDASTSLSLTWYQYRPSNKSYREVYLTFSGIAKEGDEITLVVGNLDGGVYYTIVFEVPASADSNTYEAIRLLSTKITQPTDIRTSGDSVILHFPTRGDGQTPDGGREQLLRASIDLANAGTGASKSVSALKSNSGYQLALAHYDKYGRPFPISTDDRYIIKTQSYSQLQGLATAVTWQINNPVAPEGAASAQWLLSLNGTHQTTLFVLGKIATSTTQFITLNINSLKEFNEGNEASILEYDFTAGDRCTFHYYDNSGKQWLSNPSIDVEVIGFEIEVTEDTPPVTNYLLKVRRSSQVVVDDLTGKNILLEIYSPRKRVLSEGDLDTTLFYEVGEQIDIVDGNYTVTSGEIRDGDSYFKTRQMENAIDANLENIQVESFHFSDFYISNYTSYGRPRSYYDVNEREEKKASIRYSDVFRLGSEVNGITRFYPERIYGDGDGETSSDFGWINKIRQRDNYLVCIQELKIWHIPVFTSIIEDQAGQQQIAISDRILGQARGLQSGKYGMGGAKESYAESKNGTIYFVDPNNSMPLRDGYDGVKAIAGNMSKFFKRVLQEAKNDGKKIIGWFDEYNQEYVIAIETLGDIVTSFAFSSDNFLTEDDYIVNPADLSEGTPPTKGVVSINTTTGIATYTPNTGETGTDNFTFTFLDGANVITKRACIVINEGTTTVNQFTFGDLTDASQSTVYESNPALITGNNIPVEASIVDGEFEINDDNIWHTTPQMVNADDSIKVRVTSSALSNTSVSSTLTVSDKSDTFTVTTEQYTEVTGQVLMSTIPVTNGPNPADTYNFSFGPRYTDTGEIIFSAVSAAGADGVLVGPYTIDIARAVDCYFEVGLNNTNGATIDAYEIQLEMWLDAVLLKTGALTITNDPTTDSAALATLTASWINVDLSVGGALELRGYPNTA